MKNSNFKFKHFIRINDRLRQTPEFSSKPNVNITAVLLSQKIIVGIMAPKSSCITRY